MKTLELARSAGGLSILGYEFGTTLPTVLILGGVHGDEPEGVVAAQELVSRFLGFYPYNFGLLIVPSFNADGVLNRQRTNAHGVDLNRNLPTKDWSPEVKTARYHPGPLANSEPENQWLSKWITEQKPRLILSLHSWHPVLNVNGNCRDFAEVLKSWTGYKIDDDIGYPTPGCLGTFAGIERTSPTLTYEIERGLSFSEIIRVHVPAIQEALKILEKT